jgi:hypothetical protein
MKKYYTYHIKGRVLGILPLVIAYFGITKVILAETRPENNLGLFGLIISYIFTIICLYGAIYFLIKTPYFDRPLSLDQEKITSYFMGLKLSEIRFEDIRVIKRPLEFEINTREACEEIERRTGSKSAAVYTQIVTLIDKHGKKIHFTNFILFDNWREIQKEDFYKIYAMKDAFREIVKRVDPEKCKIVYQKQKWDAWSRKDLFERPVSEVI